LHVRTEGIKKKSSRILDITAKICGTQQEERKKDLINPLNAELNAICHLLALLVPRNILHVSRLRVN